MESLQHSAWVPFTLPGRSYLVKAAFSSTNYVILITDLVHMWSESHPDIDRRNTQLNPGIRAGTVSRIMSLLRESLEQQDPAIQYSVTMIESAAARRQGHGAESLLMQGHADPTSDGGADGGAAGFGDAALYVPASLNASLLAAGGLDDYDSAAGHRRSLASSSSTPSVVRPSEKCRFSFVTVSDKKFRFHWNFDCRLCPDSAALLYLHVIQPSLLLVRELTLKNEALSETLRLSNEDVRSLRSSQALAQRPKPTTEAQRQLFFNRQHLEQHSNPSDLVFGSQLRTVTPAAALAHPTTTPLYRQIMELLHPVASADQSTSMSTSSSSTGPAGAVAEAVVHESKLPEVVAQPDIPSTFADVDDDLLSVSQQPAVADVGARTASASTIPRRAREAPPQQQQVVAPPVDEVEEGLAEITRMREEKLRKKEAKERQEVAVNPRAKQRRLF
ncbi:hypothetical protein CAOG_03390 [Capsaspora owczarzaki ATCC 30864]|nr:hypothetical protein CAOG_03390 [Capsaspora owczarzaki ATCC 30864]|eukprot:XP_004364229.1 hypothetical protein CAOG_03390 [Capsaspora owczarzaki ATCC 30864]